MYRNFGYKKLNYCVFHNQRMKAMRCPLFLKNSLIISQLYLSPFQFDTSHLDKLKKNPFY